MNPIPSWPGRGRVTLVLLAVVPVALAYPWQSTRDYVLLGVAAAVVIGLFGFWRGLYFTTIARRGLQSCAADAGLPSPQRARAQRCWCGLGRRHRIRTCCR